MKLPEGETELKFILSLFQTSLTGSARITTCTVAFPGVSKLTRGVKIFCFSFFISASMFSNLKTKSELKVSCVISGCNHLLYPVLTSPSHSHQEKVKHNFHFMLSSCSHSDLRDLQVAIGITMSHPPHGQPRQYGKGPEEEGNQLPLPLGKRRQSAQKLWHDPLLRQCPAAPIYTEREGLKESSLQGN